MSYQPKVYREQGGDRLVVADGGEIEVKAGGALKVGGVTIDPEALDELNALNGLTASVAELNKLDGAGDVVASGTAAAHIADPTGAVTDQDDEARAAIAAILDALEAFGIVLPS